MLCEVNRKSMLRGFVWLEPWLDIQKVKPWWWGNSRKEKIIIGIMCIDNDILWWELVRLILFLLLNNIDCPRFCWTCLCRLFITLHTESFVGGFNSSFLPFELVYKLNRWWIRLCGNKDMDQITHRLHVVTIPNIVLHDAYIHQYDRHMHDLFRVPELVESSQHRPPIHT